MDWYLEVWRKYGDFGGRARRREYWMFQLLNDMAFVALYGLMIAGGARLAPVSLVLFGVYCLAVIIPSIAVTVRRLHDTGRSGWWQLIALLPLVGVFILLYFLVQDGESDRNEYGPNPKTVGLFGGSTPATSFGQ
jgi:uncharacterized membrane protein YhaH (DUF805 family)